MDDLTGGALEALFFVVFDLSETCAGRQYFYSVSSDLLPLRARNDSENDSPAVCDCFVSYFVTYFTSSDHSLLRSHRFR